MAQMRDSDDYAFTLRVERDEDRPCGKDTCTGYHVLVESPEDENKLVTNEVVLAALLMHVEEILDPVGMRAAVVPKALFDMLRRGPGCGHQQGPTLGEGSHFGTPSPRPPSDGGTVPPWQR